MYFSRILTQVFSEQLFFIFYFNSFTYYGQKKSYNKKSYRIWFTFALLKFCSIFVIITQAHQSLTDYRIVKKYFVSH